VSTRARLQKLGRQLSGISDAAAAPVPVRIGQRPGLIAGPGGLAAGQLASASSAGGQAPQRIDQVLTPSGAGVAPGTASGIFRGREVVVYGTAPGSGIFVYSAQPVPGNAPLIESITQATTDPYGNKTITGGYAAYNNAAGTAILLSPAGLVAYTGSLAAGWSLLTTSSLSWDASGDVLLEGKANLTLESGTSLVHPVKLLMAAGSSVQAVDGIDGNTYDVERLFQYATGLPQTISSTSPAAVAGLSLAVGVGTYNVKGRFILNTAGVGGAAAEFRFTGPAATSTVMTFDCGQQSTTSVGPDQGYSLSAGYNSGFLTTQVLAAGSVFYTVHFDCDFVFSAAGTLAMQAATVTAADTYRIDQARWELYPVVA
jgi:hypothetical protein